MGKARAGAFKLGLTAFILLMGDSGAIFDTTANAADALGTLTTTTSIDPISIAEKILTGDKTTILSAGGVDLSAGDILSAGADVRKARREKKKTVRQTMT